MKPKTPNQGRLPLRRLVQPFMDCHSCFGCGHKGLKRTGQGTHTCSLLAMPGAGVPLPSGFMRKHDAYTSDATSGRAQAAHINISRPDWRRVRGYAPSTREQGHQGPTEPMLTQPGRIMGSFIPPGLSAALQLARARHRVKLGIHHASTCASVQLHRAASVIRHQLPGWTHHPPLTEPLPMGTTFYQFRTHCRRC